jgi:hypothetical protein
VVTTYIQCPCLIALLYNHTNTKSLSNLPPQRRNRFSISAIKPGTSFDTTAQSTASLISISAPSNCLSACPPFSVQFSSQSLLSHSIMTEEQRGRRRGRPTLASTSLRDNGSYSNNNVIGLLDGISYSSWTVVSDMGITVRIPRRVL